MQKIKVLVVAASVTMRKQISNLISEDSTLEVIGVARNASKRSAWFKNSGPMSWL